LLHYDIVRNWKTGYLIDLALEFSELYTILGIVNRGFNPGGQWFRWGEATIFL
jgi:hypothetical protein